MSRTLTRRAALALIGAGAVGSVAWTGGFTRLDAARNATVDTAVDANAYLTLEDLSDVNTVPTVTNQSGHDMSVTVTSPQSGVEFDVFDDDVNDGSSHTFSLSVGSTVEVDVLADGDIPVDFVATLLDSGGSPVGEISLQRTVEAQSQAGQVDVTPNVTSVGNSGKYEFELENTGNVDVTIVGIGIRYTTNPSASQVASGDIFSVGGTQLVTSPIFFDSSDHSTDTPRDFSQPESLDQGVTKTFEFDRFEDGSGSKIGMKDEDVGTRLYFDDGSTLDEDLVP